MKLKEDHILHHNNISHTKQNNRHGGVPKVAEPEDVRYGWADAPHGNLRNADNLPAALGILADWQPHLAVVDMDHDGLPDWWEDRFGLDKNSPSDSVLDSDGDGASNLNEFLAGTDPTNAASVFRIVGLQPETEDLRLTWTTVGGKTYRVQTNSIPDAGSFADLSGPISVPGTGEARSTSRAPWSDTTKVNTEASFWTLVLRERAALEGRGLFCRQPFAVVLSSGYTHPPSGKYSVMKMRLWPGDSISWPTSSRRWPGASRTCSDGWAPWVPI